MYINGEFSMGYLDDYKDRRGKCDYCKYHNATGSQRCVDCYGSAFEDTVDLYTFIRAKVTKDAIEKFNESDEGKQLYNIMDQHKQAYEQCKESYNREREKFVDAELKRIENAINALS